MRSPIFMTELHTRLGAPSSDAVECLRLLKAFLKLEPGKRFEVVDLVERLAGGVSSSDPRPS